MLDNGAGVVVGAVVERVALPFDGKWRRERTASLVDAFQRDQLVEPHMIVIDMLRQFCSASRDSLLVKTRFQAHVCCILHNHLRIPLPLLISPLLPVPLRSRAL